MAKKEVGQNTAGASLKAGLKNCSASSSDKSTQLKMTPSVNAEAVRQGTAKTPATLGPRTA